MVVKICLKCMGFKKSFFYCIVVVDLCFFCDGCFIEIVGIYNFLKDFVEVVLKEDLVFDWLLKGV